MRKSIAIDARAAREVLGTHDSHLRRVRETLGVTAVLRGGKLTIGGPADKVRRATAALEEMKSMVESLGAITPRDVERILDGVGTDAPGGGGGGWPEERLIVGGGREVEARTAGQGHYVRTMRGNDVVFCVGPAGTGKTYLAVAMALAELEAGRVNRIALARPAVEAGERLGFLPGDERQKVNPYLRPLYDALTDMMSFSALGRLMDRGVVEVVPLAFMRGRTLGHAFVILDEAQNTTTGQMLMFLTRLGPYSRAVVTGDITQIDLPDTTASGLVQACRILDGVAGIGIVHLSERDIVRHPLVRSIVAAYDADRQRSSPVRAAGGGPAPGSGDRSAGPPGSAEGPEGRDSGAEGPGS
ncbi:MAG: PhoH family protein [Planctomycetota bacterium]|jgi:phosphate starvation-inducible PhoH-like protein